MADKKISELTALTGAALVDTDLIPVVDTSATTTKKISLEELKIGLDTPSGFIRKTGGTFSGAISGTTGQFGTSLNVDGTVTADGLTVDGDVLLNGDRDFHLVASNPNSGALFQYGEITFGDSFSAQYSNHAKIISNGGYANTTNLEFHTSENNSSPLRMLIAANGDVSFYEDTGTTAKFFWDASAESLGIGTSSPTDALSVFTSADNGDGSSYTQAEISFGNTAYPVTIGSYRYGGSYLNGIDFYYNNGSPQLGMRIDASGNVGIGTASPSVFAGYTNVTLKGGANGSNLDFHNSSSTRVAAIVSNPGTELIVETGEATPLLFKTNSTERMRIDSSGNVLVGKTATTLSVAGTYISATGSLGVTRANDDTLSLNRTGTDGAIATFYNDGVSVGTISVTGSATAYNTSSDYRLKTDAQPMTGASARVQALKPVNFEWISTGERVDGFLAHEAQEVVPEAVTGTKDAMRDEEYEVTAAVYEDIITPAIEAIAGVPAVYDVDGVLVSEMVPAVEAEAERTEQRLVSEAVMGTRSVPDYQGIDQSKLVPLLTAALQEALTKIDAMEARLAALEADPLK